MGVVWDCEEEFGAGLDLGLKTRDEVDRGLVVM